MTTPRTAQDFTPVRSELVTLLNATTGIEVVNSFPRFDNRNHIGRARTRQVTTARLHSWTIIRSGATTRWITNCEVEVLHQVTLRGMLEHSDQDATADEWDDLLDAVMNALYPTLTLSGNATIQGPPQLSANEYVYWADTLVHFAEITTVVNQTVLVENKS